MTPRFNNIAGLMNPEPNGLYVRYADYVDSVAILKGIGKVDGDGWKDVTKKGEVVFVWNCELLRPYAPGQYARIGNEHWSASTKQYDFQPASADEVREILSRVATAGARYTMDQMRDYAEAFHKMRVASDALDKLTAEQERLGLYEEAPRARPVSDAMMDLADRLGSEAEDVDPRAWAHLLVYAPNQEDGKRYRWLTEDHRDAETRARCRSIIDSMGVRSYSATSRDIDAALAKEKP
jgi:hypothetical protein